MSTQTSESLIIVRLNQQNLLYHNTITKEFGRLLNFGFNLNYVINIGLLINFKSKITASYSVKDV